MFTGQAGRPETVGGVEEEEATIDDWEGRSGSGDKVYEEEEEDRDSQDFPE